MCIAAGCDYFKNIRDIGINCAFHLAMTGSDIMEALAQRGACETIRQTFTKPMQFSPSDSV